MAVVMAVSAWDQLQERATDAVRDGNVDPDLAARQLLAMCGGDRRMVLATRVRLAAISAATPDALNPRRALALVDRAIELANGDGLWHPVFTEDHGWGLDRRHAAH